MVLIITFWFPRELYLILCYQSSQRIITFRWIRYICQRIIQNVSKWTGMSSEWLEPIWNGDKNYHCHQWICQCKCVNESLKLPANRISQLVYQDRFHVHWSLDDLIHTILIHDQDRQMIFQNQERSKKAVYVRLLKKIILKLKIFLVECFWIELLDLNSNWKDFYTS